MTKFKVIYAGTPEFAVPALGALIAHHQVCAVFTQPDRPAGRGQQLTASAVKQIAVEHNISVHQPLSLKNADAQQLIADYQADVMVVAAYGLILPEAVLTLPRLGCLNIHASWLPRWRGAAPILFGLRVFSLVLVYCRRRIRPCRRRTSDVRRCARHPGRRKAPLTRTTRT